MPVYEYECREHGAFDERRALSEYASPGTCPLCGLESPRILSPPRLRSLGAAERTARDRNERSAHEPRVVTAHPARSGEARRDGPATMTAPSGGYPWAVGH